MEPVNNKFVLVRTELIECEFDRKEFDSLFLEVHENPDTTDEEKDMLWKESSRVWEKLLNKRPLIYHEDRPILRNAETLWGQDWFEAISEDILKAMAKTYKEFGRLWPLVS